MKKRALSLLLALVMIISVLPYSAIALTLDDGTAEEPYQVGSTVTISGSTYYGKYVVISDGTNSDLYYVNSSGVVETIAGATATFANGTYTVYYGIFSTGGRGNGDSSFAGGSFTVTDSTTSVSVENMKSKSVSNSSTDVYLYATSLFYNTAAFSHVDVRVAGSYVIHMGSQEYTATVSNPSVVVKVGGTQVASKSWSGTTSYEWRQTGLSLTKASIITVEMTLDLTYTDASGNKQVLEDVTIVYDSVNDVDKFIDAIAICDMVQGLDFRVTVEDIQEELEDYNVYYQWKVYHLDGTTTDDLPASLGAYSVPAAAEGLQEGTEYVYNTGFVQGTSYYDYANGLLYTFHGWDTWSHSSVFSTDVTAEGYHALDDGDTDASNNPTIPITADTWINGYWTVSELTPSDAYLMVKKVVVVADGDADYVTNYLQNTGRMYISIDPGIDEDGDDAEQVDVDYPAAASADGYRIDVYQYDDPFLFTEHQADVPGYTRTVEVTVSENSNLTLESQSGDNASVALSPEFDPAQAPYNLGTVTYTNTYTKNTGAAVSEYPSLTLVKSASDTGAYQGGVVFGLYSDADCTTSVGTFTTTAAGEVVIPFDNMTAGTYYLKELTPVSGYEADATIYPVTLAVRETKEETRWNAETNQYEYVQVTYYTLSAAVPEGSDASYTASDNTGYYRLHVYNDPILASLNVSKTTTGLNETDKEKLNALVIVHGPITRDSEGNITDIGDTYQLNLASPDFTATLSGLHVGEYLIHESFASIHGYTWNSVKYGDLETVVYNGITSGVFKVETTADINLTLTNDYTEWTAADFYIKKVGSDGTTGLTGATFEIFLDAACTVAAMPDDFSDPNATLSATTGADGYAHFSGYIVPDTAGADGTITFYVRETKAPAGYYLSSNVYKVEIKAETHNGKTTYEPTITLVSGEAGDAHINTETDLITVTNHPVMGKLTITKTFAGGILPEGLESVELYVSGPNGYAQKVVLSKAGEKPWTVELTGLALGDYTLYEMDGNVPGYTWSVEYSSETISLTESDPGYTVAGTDISGSATITNTYTKNEETYEIPTTLTVKKVDEDGTTPLAGAVFSLQRLDTRNNNADMGTVSFTTNDEGTVVFDLLSGFIINGDDVDGTYILTETLAPEGYQASTTTWTVTIKEDNGEIRVVLNENKNVFENFWDWIVGGITGEGTTEWSFTDGVLTVENKKKVGTLTVTKTVSDEKGHYADAGYSFTLDASDDSFDKTFTLKAGETYTLENIPWGTTYTLTENTTGAAFTSTITDAGNGKIWADNTEITVANTYAYQTHNNGLNLVKVDADDTAKVIAGAGFTLYSDEDCKTAVGTEVFSNENGEVKFDIAAAGTYYLKETTAPTGYHPNEEVYVVTAAQKYVVKDAGTANAVTEIQMHITVSGLTGTTSNQIDYVYSIENTAIKTVVVTVEKVWDDGNYHARPESVEVNLYRDGEVYEKVTLNETNNWRYTWNDLTDEYSWSVDEVNVPTEYTKTVTNNGNNWTITNARTPKSVEITVTKAWNHNGGKNLPESISVTLYKDNTLYETVGLSEENDWTYTWSDLTDVSVWSIDETVVPTGYDKKIEVDGYKFKITNTRIINPVEIHVNKVWVASEGVEHPESIVVVLYRDGDKYDTIKLSEKNGWAYTWTDLTDEYTWTVDEKEVPAGYTKNVEVTENVSEGKYSYDWTITNTKDFKYIDVSVKKIWNGSGVTHPTSVKVTLYRNGVAYDTVTLSASNNWQHTWEGLTDEFEWEVDEPSVPSGYNKTVRVYNTYDYYISNTHEDNPKTGDFTDMLGMGLLGMVGVVGFCFTAFLLFVPRKKGKYER